MSSLKGASFIGVRATTKSPPGDKIARYLARLMGKRSKSK